MSSKTRLTVTGLDETLSKLNDLSARLRGAALRKALAASQKPLLSAARGRVPRRSGLLKKSLGRKVKIYRSGSGVAVTGPRAGITGEYLGRPLRPVRYAHLVELGTKRAGAKPFMEPAARSSEGAMLAAMANVLKAELAKVGR